MPIFRMIKSVIVMMNVVVIVVSGPLVDAQDNSTFSPNVNSSSTGKCNRHAHQIPPFSNYIGSVLLCTF